MTSATRCCFRRIYELLIEVGSTPEEAGSFLSMGMTLNALQAMRALDPHQDWTGSTPWADAMLPKSPDSC